MSRLLTPAEAQAALKSLPELAQREAQRVIDVTAFQVSEEARRRVPVATGTLRDSIKWSSRPRSLSAVVGIDGVYYWRFLEYGTVKMGARPFLRPAALGIEQDHFSRMERALARAAAEMERSA